MDDAARDGAVGSLVSGGLDADAAEQFMLWAASGEAEISEIAEQLRTLDTSTRLPAGFVFDVPPAPIHDGSEVLVGNGRLADGSARVYVYAINGRGLPMEMLLTAEQARTFARDLLEAIDRPGGRAGVRFKVEQLISHHDIDVLPRF